MSPSSSGSTIAKREGLLFDPEDGGHMFLRNVRWLSTDTRRYIPEDRTLHNRRCENRKSYTTLLTVLKYYRKMC
jgi:hypothetical protein